MASRKLTHLTCYVKAGSGVSRGTKRGEWAGNGGGFRGVSRGTEYIYYISTIRAGNQHAFYSLLAT